MAGSSKGTKSFVSNPGPLHHLTKGYGPDCCFLIALNVVFGKRVAETMDSLRSLSTVRRKDKTMATFSKLKIDKKAYHRKTIIDSRSHFSKTISDHNIVKKELVRDEYTGW